MRPDLAAMIADAQDAAREVVALSEEHGAAARYPLLVNGKLHWILSVGPRDTRLASA